VPTRAKAQRGKNCDERPSSLDEVCQGPSFDEDYGNDGRGAVRGALRAVATHMRRIGGTHLSLATDS
jgi:hypothetical protein